MEEIIEFENLLEELAEELEPHLPLFFKYMPNIKTTDKPLSIFSMTTFLPKVESIRSGIFEVAKIDEYYSLNILFRSLIEHFIKAQYIWMKTVANKNDAIGIDYWVFGQDQENIDYANALAKYYSFVGIVPKKAPIEILKEMGVLSKDKSANQIRKISEQFNYKNMAHYITEQLTKKTKVETTILSSMIPHYSELSSCVHGGPDSVGTYEKGPEAKKEILEMATFASLYTRWLVFTLIFQYEKSIEPLGQITHKYLQKFTGEKTKV